MIGYTYTTVGSLKISVPDLYQDRAGPPPCQCVGHAQIVSGTAIGG